MSHESTIAEFLERVAHLWMESPVWRRFAYPPKELHLLIRSDYLHQVETANANTEGSVEFYYRGTADDGHERFETVWGTLHLHQYPWDRMYDVEKKTLTILLRPEKIVSPRYIEDGQRHLPVVRTKPSTFDDSRPWVIICGVRESFGGEKLKYGKQISIAEPFPQASYVKLYDCPKLILDRIGAERGSALYGRIMRKYASRKLCQ